MAEKKKRKPSRVVRIQELLSHSKQTKEMQNLTGGMEGGFLVPLMLHLDRSVLYKYVQSLHLTQIFIQVNQKETEIHDLWPKMSCSQENNCNYILPICVSQQEQFVPRETVKQNYFHDPLKKSKESIFITDVFT